MDALELLKADHERVTALFREAESSDSANKKWVIFESIRQELTTHTYIEETIFYPAFRRYDEFKDLLDRSYREHGEVKSTLLDLQNLGPHSESSRIQNQLDLLEAIVSAHVEEEETIFFPLVRKTMRRPERELLGRHISTAKHERSEAA